MNIVFFGTPSFVIPVLSSLMSHFSVVGIVTAPDKPVGRKQIITPSPIRAAYRDKGVVITDEKFSDETIEQLSALKPDLFVVAAYGKIIPGNVLAIPRLGAINIHPSKLPFYRGASPIQASILAGEKESAVSIIKMDEEMDHGPLLMHYPFSITLNDTFESVAEKSFSLAAKHLPELLTAYTRDEIKPITQIHDDATFCKIIKKNDGYIDGKNPPSPEQVDRMIRAYYPWPGVWTTLQMANGKWQRVKLLPNNMLQMEGKNPVTVKDFLNGYSEMKGIISKLIPNYEDFKQQVAQLLG